MKSRFTFQHIAVLRKGHFYKLFIVDAHGQDLSTLDIQAQFEWIVKDAEKQTGSRITFNLCLMLEETGSIELQLNYF